LPKVGSIIEDLAIFDEFAPQSITVTLSVEHDYDPALRIRLLHNGHVIKLVDGCPTAGEDYIGTVLSDDAATLVCDGQPPYTGTFMPNESLDIFENESIAGPWRLIVSSTGAGGCGRLLHWRMEFAAAAADCNANGVPDDCDIADGILQDADGDGVPDECDSPCPEVLGSTPADGAIDARQPHAIDDAGALFGWQAIRLQIAGGPTPVGGDFEVTQEGVDGPPPTVSGVRAVGDDEIEVQFDRPITPGAWTTLTHTCSAAAVRIGYLPGDVNGDGVTAPLDILALIDGLNGLTDLPEYAEDINRSGQGEPADILRLIDLLNGAGQFEEWNGRQLP